MSCEKGWRWGGQLTGKEDGKSRNSRLGLTFRIQGLSEMNWFAQAIKLVSWGAKLGAHHGLTLKLRLFGERSRSGGNRWPPLPCPKA